MNLHFKLFIPVLLLLVAIASTMHFYWLPNYLALEIDDQQKTEHAYAGLLGIALIPDLINNDLAKIHTTLDHVLENREYWYAINLYAQDNQIIYPLASPKLPEDIELEILKHKIMFDGYTIAQLEVWIDINAASALRVEHIYHLEQLLLLTLLAAALLSTMLQDRWIRYPLKQLATFASNIAGGKYDATMEYHSHDEVGELIEAFDSMRQQIKQRETALIESQARNTAMIENAVDGIISINIKGTVESFNSAAEKIFGYAADEVVGAKY